jgi:hypothetical protein
MIYRLCHGISVPEASRDMELLLNMGKRPAFASQSRVKIMTQYTCLDSRSLIKNGSCQSQKRTSSRHKSSDRGFDQLPHSRTPEFPLSQDNFLMFPRNLCFISSLLRGTEIIFQIPPPGPSNLYFIFVRFDILSA